HPAVVSQLYGSPEQSLCPTSRKPTYVTRKTRDSRDTEPELLNRQPQFLSPAQEAPSASTSTTGAHTPATRHQSPAPEQNEPSEAKRPKQRLGDIAKYDGKDKAKYREFSIEMTAKLEIDGNAIGDEKTQVWYAYSGLA